MGLFGYMDIGILRYTYLDIEDIGVLSNWNIKVWGQLDIYYEISRNWDIRILRYRDIGILRY